jgi:hypothetical protein
MYLQYAGERPASFSIIEFRDGQGKSCRISHKTGVICLKKPDLASAKSGSLFS